MMTCFDTKFMTVMIGFILVFLYSNPIIRFLISDNTIFLFGLGKKLLAISSYYACSVPVFRVSYLVSSPIPSPIYTVST